MKSMCHLSANVTSPWEKISTKLYYHLKQMYMKANFQQKSSLRTKCLQKNMLNS
eukprot:CAMPEP_0202975492 /NCGR_PEP_ID=MMETSP1396-20130829/69551_1 /ASSEMBLY_ACC=CAM_ASM_000872 /TAXON_ID= /ORGANISM="Pseudokeronopsis sp., Strain Brazil" /LENGTH=53 /DNA_ID=CAMNT_0049711173 /DNA_START=49 /DNA_END=207 /DNA_ORIENTATION=+